MIIYYIIIILIFLYSLKQISLNTGPTNPLINKGYPTKDDNINIILDRLEWSNHYPGRIVYLYRYLLYSVIISFISSIIIFNKLPSGQLFMQMTLGIFVILFMLQSFFSHHADKFSSFCIDENLKLIRKHLNKKRGNFNKLSKTTTKFTGKDECLRFFYRFND